MNLKAQTQKTQQTQRTQQTQQTHALHKRDVFGPREAPGHHSGGEQHHHDYKRPHRGAEHHRAGMPPLAAATIIVTARLGFGLEPRQVILIPGSCSRPAATAVVISDLTGFCPSTLLGRHTAKPFHWTSASHHSITIMQLKGARRRAMFGHRVQHAPQKCGLPQERGCAVGINSRPASVAPQDVATL